MSGASSIEWTDATWNPVRGCSRVSEGCRNCYAERHAARFGLNGVNGPMPFHGFAEFTKGGPRWTGRVELVPSALGWPLGWQGSGRARAEGRPSRVFVNSMSDLFHERLDDASIAAVFGVMAAAPEHTFQVLTKRPERMRDWLAAWSRHAAELDVEVGADRGEDPSAWWAQVVANERLTDRALDVRAVPWPLPNVWLGVSVEDQATADERIPLLLQAPAAKRFVSYEPALGPVDFGNLPAPNGCTQDALWGRNNWNGRIGAERINWVIVGGESGPGARPFDVAWARSTVAQCRAAGVACFVKQLGARPVEWCPGEVPLPAPGEKKAGDPCRRCGAPAGTIGMAPIYLGSRKGGDWNEWPEDLRVREFPA